MKGTIAARASVWLSRLSRLAESPGRRAARRERQRLEQERAALYRAVQQDHAMLASLTEQMSDGLLILDGESRLRFCNAQSAQFFGLDRTTALGRPLAEVLSSVAAQVQDLPLVRQRWATALARAHERPAVECVLQSAGRQRFLRADLFSMADALGPGYTGVMVKDITSERELLHSKDQLVSVVSHEIRNPLAAILGFAELLKAGMIAQSGVEGALETIHRESLRLSSLLDDLLDIQRIESGRTRLNLQPVELHSVVDEVVELTWVQASPQHHLVLNLPEGLPRVRGDRDKLKQVFSNLLGNAIKYSPMGGQVTIQAQATHVPAWAGGLCQPSAKAITVTVQDEGLGIPPDALPRLFEPFYRVVSDDRRKVAGSGLGLAIVKTIIEAHGGGITAESELGQGSTFRFWLPVAAEAETPSGAEPPLIEDEVIGGAYYLHP